MTTTTTIAIIIIAACIIILIIRKDPKYGINIKRVYCPECNLKQPIIRKPKNDRQVLYGGYTCKKCKTEMDKYGSKIIN